MTESTRKYQIRWIYLALTLTTLAAYWQVKGHDFVNLDDSDYVTDNPNVLAGLTPDSIKWAFTAAHSGNWHPLTWLSHMLDCQLFATDAGWHHITNLLLHVANTLLLFTLLNRMTNARWKSAFVAAAFALHPLHVESVAWISERKDVLSTLFWMLTILSYIRYAERTALTRYLLTLLAFAAGLMAKPMLVTLPLVLLLLDYWPLSRFQSGQTNTHAKTRPILYLIAEKIPFLVIALISSIVTFLVQQSSGAVKDAALKIRIANAFLSYAKYIEKTIWPTRLAAFYPHLRENVPILYAAIAALILLAITFCILRQSRHRPWLILGWFWYLGTLVPVIGIIQVGTQAMADRYTYVPLIGLFIIIAWQLPDLIGKWRYKKAVLALAAAVAILAMALGTRRQAAYWQNSYALFEHATKVTNNNYVAYHGLGTALYNQQDYEQAIANYKKTLSIRPNHANAPGNIGLALLKLEDYDQAANWFRKALTRYGERQKWHAGLAAALQQQGRLDQARDHLNNALKIKPDNINIRKKLADILFLLQEFSQATVNYRQIAQAAPSDPNAHNNLAVALTRSGRLDLAIKSYEQVLKLRPDSIAPMNNLAWYFAAYPDAEFHNPQKAINLAQRACQLTNYQNPTLLDTLATAYAAVGEFSNAVETLEKALKLPEVSQNQKLIDQIQSNLSSYRAGRLYAQPTPESEKNTPR